MISAGLLCCREAQGGSLPRMRDDRVADERHHLAKGIVVGMGKAEPGVDQPTLLHRQDGRSRPGDICLVDPTPTSLVYFVESAVSGNHSLAPGAYLDGTDCKASGGFSRYASV